METGKAIYYLLKDSAEVGAICADRIYPEIGQQDVDAPFVAYTVTDTTPSGTKSGSSDLDTARAELYMISPDYAQCMDLGIAVRSTLDRQGGDIGPAGNTVAVQSIDFDSSDIEFDVDQRVYILEHTYNIRIQRTGQAISYSLAPSNSITIEEVDGSPTGKANKLVFSNGTVTIAGNTATITSGGALTVKEVDGAPSDSASTIIVPNGTLSFSGSEATLNLTLDTLDTTGILEQIALQLADGFGVTSSDFPNGLIGDFNQDGYVGSNDLLLFLSYFGESLDSDATERSARLSSAFSAGTDAPLDLVRSINSETADRDGDINLSSSEVPEGTNLYFTDARTDARIALATVDNLADTPAGIGTAGQVLAVNSGRTGYEFVNQPTTPDLSDYVQSVNDEAPDETGNVVLTTELVPENTNLYYTDARFDTRYATKTRYHDRYATEAETARSGATANVELYYTARPDGDGIAESATSDTGVTDTINRTLYYATKFDADPDTAADWTEYTTQPADNATFATAKAALLAGLNDTDATAETRGTLPLSLKMVRTTTAAPGDLLLDTYTGAAAAYSVRKLDKDYTGYAMKVREDSGDTEADIGFDSSGNLDTSAIATHCGSANGYVVTWYDQSGNANNATQSTAGNQPQIYNGTAVITKNGEPGPQFSGSEHLNAGNIWASATGPKTSLAVINLDVANTLNFGGQYVSFEQQSFVGNQSGNFRFNDKAQITITGAVIDTDFLHAWQNHYDDNGTKQLRARVNSGTFSTVNTTGRSHNTLTIGGQVGYGIEGLVKELVIWESTQSDTNISAIETDINTHFSIYT
jgi:hypothetical protein